MLGLEPMPVPKAGGGSTLARAPVAPAGRDGRREGFGPRPGTSCTQEGGPRRGDSLSALSTL